MSDDARVLLAVRVGEESEAPARTAAWLGSAIGARVTLLHVATELETAGQVAVGAGMDEDEVRENMREDARSRAEELARATLGDTPYDIVIAEGPVAERVLAVAEEIGAALIVAGSRARGAIGSAILGGTSRDILRGTACPVVVVPPGIIVARGGPVPGGGAVPPPGAPPAGDAG